MGLFDDILKKPTPPAGQATPPGDPLGGSSGSTPQNGGQPGQTGTSPVIVKSETSTVFGPESEAEAIRTQNTPPSMPTVHAEEDSSSVLMSSNQASTPIAPIAPVQPPMEVTPVVNEPVVQAPISAEVAQPVQTAPQPVLQETPVVPAQPAQVSQDAFQIPAGPSLFDHIMNDDLPASPAPVNEPQAPVGFQFTSEPNQNSVTTTSENSNTTPMTQPTPQESVATNASSYATPREFIENSLDNIETMLATIDGRHAAKMTEAEGYRMEKMRFAELEKNAYAEAEIMDRERDHTLRMKSIFERELETDEANRTRKVQAHQDVHVEKHPQHAHKRHVHEEEEDAIAAS